MMNMMMKVKAGLLAVEPRHGRELKLHRLKTLTRFFDAVMIGLKPFEVRYNDRDYQVGDFLLLQEYDPSTETYGRETMRQVTYVFQGGAQPSTQKAAVDHVVAEGWVVMGLADVPELKRQELYDTIEVWNKDAMRVRVGDLWELEQVKGEDMEVGTYWITDISSDRRSVKAEQQHGDKAGGDHWVPLEMLHAAAGWAHVKRGGGV
jgi:hypothetical protein